MSWRYVQPVFPLLLLVSACALLIALRRRSRRAVATALASCLLTVLWAWPPCHYLLALPFELPYATPLRQEERVDAIVVLSGAVRTPDQLNPQALPGYDTYVRCAHAAWLYRERFRVPVVTTGGGQPGYTAAEVSATLLAQMGVPKKHILFEKRSRSTWENALFAAQILRQRGCRRVAVVTQAYHMRRAVAVFTKLGFEVVPAACDFTISGGPFQELLPDGTTVRRNELLFHELIAYLWYWIRGRV